MEPEIVLLEEIEEPVMLDVSEMTTKPSKTPRKKKGKYSHVTSKVRAYRESIQQETMKNRKRRLEKVEIVVTDIDMLMRELENLRAENKSQCAYLEMLKKENEQYCSRITELENANQNHRIMINNLKASLDSKNKTPAGQRFNFFNNFQSPLNTVTNALKTPRMHDVTFDDQATMSDINSEDISSDDEILTFADNSNNLRVWNSCNTLANTSKNSDEPLINRGKSTLNRAKSLLLLLIPCSKKEGEDKPPKRRKYITPQWLKSRNRVHPTMVLSSIRPSKKRYIRQSSDIPKIKLEECSPTVSVILKEKNVNLMSQSAGPSKLKKKALFAKAKNQELNAN